jgi:hypothetical protein
VPNEVGSRARRRLLVSRISPKSGQQTLVSSDPVSSDRRERTRSATDAHRQALVSGPLLASDEEDVAVADSLSARKELSILTCSLAGVSRCVQVVVQWQRWSFRCDPRWTVSSAQGARLEVDRDRSSCCEYSFAPSVRAPFPSNPLRNRLLRAVRARNQVGGFAP